MAVYTDDFNRANANLAAPWGTMSGEVTFAVVANQCTPTGGLGSDAANYYNNVFGNDQYSQFVLKALSGGTPSTDSGGGPAVRCSTSARTYYRIIIHAAASNNTVIAKFVAGAFSLVSGYATVPWAVNDVVRVEVSGTRITVKRNGSSVLSFTDSSIASGVAGIDYSSAITGFTIDDWEGGDLSAARRFILGRH